MLFGRFHKIGANITWLVWDRIFRMVVGVIVLGFVARYLGTTDFGYLNYAINLTAIFASMASLGIDGIVIRELVKAPHLASRILGTAWLLKVTGALLAIGLTAFSCLIFASASAATPLILIVSLAFLPQAFDVIDLWFQKNIQSKYAVLAKSVVILAGAGIKIALVKFRAPLPLFALAYVLDALLVSATLMAVYHLRKQSIFTWRPSKAIAQGLLRDSWPLILSGLLVALYMRIEQILVMNVLGGHSSGVYYASVRLAEIWNVIPGLILTTIYPLLVEKQQSDLNGYKRSLQTIFDLLTGLGFLVAVGVTLTAPFLIPIIYGPDFGDAVPILVIQAWAAPITFSGAVRAQYFLMENLTIYHTWSALLGIVTNVLLALVLMPRIGPRGAALSALAGYWVSAHLTSLFFRKLRECGGIQTKALLLPFRLPTLVRAFRATR